MHRNRTKKRRGAPSKPKRRAGRAAAREPQRRSIGFEGLIPASGYDDYFFSGFISDPDEAAEILEHGESRESFESNPRLGVTFSAAFHIFIAFFLLIEPSLELLGARDSKEEQEQAEKKRQVLVFL